MTATDRTPVVGGRVERGFEPVRDAFVENFTRRGEIGAACCAYQHGRKVVDLWGGVRDRASRSPFGSGDQAFGAPGAGGSMGHADPATGIGYGYVTNRMGTELSGDRRDVALRRAIDGAVSAGRT